MVSKSFIIAYEKGYRIFYREVHSPKGNVLKFKKSDRYPKFNIRHKGKHITVKAHQLLAYQIFGLKCIGKKVVVRHKDDDPWNLSLKNIILGTMEENYRDRKRNSKR